jgi:nucleoid-associated protein YgaU
MKFKFKLPKLKMPGSRRKKLRATALRRPLRAATAEYDEMAEPNMKLSRALLIVLILHVVAVSGIIAFNAIKTRERPVTIGVPASPETAAPAKAAAKTEATAAPMEIKRAHAVAKADDSRRTYTVVKGDNPVAIAKKLKVSYDDLIALNHIDDPHKLKVGQKLLVPSKTVAKAKKVDE